MTAPISTARLRRSRFHKTITSIYDGYTRGTLSHPDVNLWQSADHALEYLALADTIPHRAEGERELALLVGTKPG